MDEHWKCPGCGLVNPPDSPICFCGEFARDEKPGAEERLARARRPAHDWTPDDYAAVAVLAAGVLGLVAMGIFLIWSA